MTIAHSVEKYLGDCQIQYQVLSHVPTEGLEQAADAVGVPCECVARAVVMRTPHELVMAVLPLTRLIDFRALERLTDGAPHPVAADELHKVFEDCERGCIPPFGQAYGLAVLYDQALLASDFVVLEGGGRDSLIRIEHDGMARLMQLAATGPFSRSVEVVLEEADKSGFCGLTPWRDLQARIAEIYKLPAMPGHAQRLLALQGDPNTTARDLAEVVELDPSLAAQVMQYARSPFFGYPGKVETVQEAISRVLGFDMVVNLAMGLALLQPFDIPPSGPLGLKAFWRDATFTAALAQRLTKAVPYSQRPKPGLVFLSGLLHNFGFLLFGHLFQPEYFLLNRMLAANPRVPVTALEKQVLCMGQAKDVLCLGHASVGSWLMHAWNMPDEVVTAVGEHHNPEYRGAHAVYSNLVLVAGHLLKPHGMSDAEGDIPPAAALNFLGLDVDQGRAAAESLVEECEPILAQIEHWVA